MPQEDAKSCNCACHDAGAASAARRSRDRQALAAKLLMVRIKGLEAAEQRVEAMTGVVRELLYTSEELVMHLQREREVALQLAASAGVLRSDSTGYTLSFSTLLSMVCEEMMQ